MEEKRLTDEKYYYTITYGCPYVQEMCINETAERNMAKRLFNNWLMKLKTR